MARIDEPEPDEESSSSYEDYVSESGSEDDQGIKIEEVAEASGDVASGEDCVSSAVHFALMAETSDNKSSEKKDDKAPNAEVPSNSDSSSSEPSCSKCKEKDDKIEYILHHNEKLVDDLTCCKDQNQNLVKKEKECMAKIQELTVDVSELTKTVLNKQDAINSYINQIDALKRDLANAKCDYETIKQKLDSYTNSQYVLDHILQVQRDESNRSGLGYHVVPPPMHNNLAIMPEAEEITCFEGTAPLVADPQMDSSLITSFEDE